MTLEHNHSCVCAPGSYFHDIQNLYRQYCVVPVGFGDFSPLLSSVGHTVWLVSSRGRSQSLQWFSIKKLS